nr:unnamed protein product [Digitaria exilis]
MLVCLYAHIRARRGRAIPSPIIWHALELVGRTAAKTKPSLRTATSATVARLCEPEARRLFHFHPRLRFDTVARLRQPSREWPARAAVFEHLGMKIGMDEGRAGERPLGWMATCGREVRDEITYGCVAKPGDRRVLLPAACCSPTTAWRSAWCGTPGAARRGVHALPHRSCARRVEDEGGLQPEPLCPTETTCPRPPQPQGLGVDALPLLPRVADRSGRQGAHGPFSNAPGRRMAARHGPCVRICERAPSLADTCNSSFLDTPLHSAAKAKNDKNAT